MKVIIAGPRYKDPVNKIPYTSVEYLDFVSDKIRKNEIHITEVVSGKAIGFDTIGEDWAKSNDVPVKEFRADWDKYGKKAGPIRNEEMGDYADAAIVFWNGKSKGSKHMIHYMTHVVKKPCLVVILGD